jgi:hypothetical protein
MPQIFAKNHLFWIKSWGIKFYAEQAGEQVEAGLKWAVSEKKRSQWCAIHK